MRTTHVEIEGARLHLVRGGRGSPVLFLHGFPEFWYAWRRQLPALADTFDVMAIDLPGCNLSDPLPNLEDHRPDRLADRIAALIQQVSPATPISLVGHDLGGTLAWEVAARHPELVERLVIVDALPAAALARQLERDPAQRAASAYIETLRSPGAEVGLTARGCERLGAMVFDGARDPSVFGSAERKAYVASWSRPGTVASSLAYYRAWTADVLPAPRVRAPTLVIWGEDDPHLLPGWLDELDRYARDARVLRIPGATHWVHHEEPERVTEAIRGFLAPVSLDTPVFDVIRERETWRRHPDYGCFLSSPDNPHGLRLDPTVDRGRVWVRTTFDRDRSGIVGLAHCGVVFTVLEGLMGWLVMSHAGRLGMTTDATIQNLGPVRVGQPYEFEAVPDPDRPNTPSRVHVLARAFPVGEPDRPCAIARAQFFLPSRRRAEALLGRPIDVSPELFDQG